MIDKIIKEAEQALEVYCDAYDKKQDIKILESKNIHKGLCFYLYSSNLLKLYKIVSKQKYWNTIQYPWKPKSVYMYGCPNHIKSWRGNKMISYGYKALLPRIVYLQTLIKELKKDNTDG